MALASSAVPRTMPTPVSSQRRLDAEHEWFGAVHGAARRLHASDLRIVGRIGRPAPGRPPARAASRSRRRRRAGSSRGARRSRRSRATRRAPGRRGCRRAPRGTARSHRGGGASAMRRVHEDAAEAGRGARPRRPRWSGCRPWPRAGARSSPAYATARRGPRRRRRRGSSRAASAISRAWPSGHASVANVARSIAMIASRSAAVARRSMPRSSRSTRFGPAEA